MTLKELVEQAIREMTPQQRAEYERRINEKVRRQFAAIESVTRMEPLPVVEVDPFWPFESFTEAAVWRSPLADLVVEADTPHVVQEKCHDR